jgi:hypothetical protein
MGSAWVRARAIRDRHGVRLSSGEHGRLSGASREAARPAADDPRAQTRGQRRMFDPMLAEREGADMTEVMRPAGRDARRVQPPPGADRRTRRDPPSQTPCAGQQPWAWTGPRPVGRCGRRARLGEIGGQNQGANARDAFVFEHLEIALLALLEQLADHSGACTLAASSRVDAELSCGSRRAAGTTYQGASRPRAHGGHRLPLRVGRGR